MIDFSALLGFLIAASLLTVTPGVDTALVLRAAARSGRRPAMLVSIGIAVGCLVWGAAASLGLSALLGASKLAYAILKLAGTVYLMWLGLSLLIRCRPIALSADEHSPAGFAGRAFRQGLLTNLLNPKVGIFYVTFLPQFIPQGAAVTVYSFVLTCLHVALTLGWFALLIAATAPLGHLLRHPRVNTALDRMTGTVLLGFGLKLATSQSR